MSVIIYSDATKKTAIYAKAIGHPARLLILKKISNGECNYISDLLVFLPLAQSTISQHIKELVASGLIVKKLELPKVKYTIHHENMKAAKRLLETIFNESFMGISGF